MNIWFAPQSFSASAAPVNLWSSISLEERTVVEPFQLSYSRDSDGRFKETGSHAHRRIQKECYKVIYQLGAFVTNERNIRGVRKRSSGIFLTKPRWAGSKGWIGEDVHGSLLPSHSRIRKEDSCTRKVRVVFDASAHSTSGVSLNDHFMVRPTVHSSLIDLLLRFRGYKVALTTDVSRMYRVVLL